MAIRKSARIQNLTVVQELDGDKQNPPTEASIPEQRGKRRAPATAKPMDNTAATNPRKAQGTTKPGKSKAATGQAKTGSNGKLAVLPVEILTMILNNVTEASDMSALCRSSKFYCAQMMPRLYGRVAVSANYHAHIAKLIRTLETHLSVAQKKQLKKEAKYKGQQERYPSGLDTHMVPTCASHIKHFEVGHSDPGRKHEHIVKRYVEEAFKSMGNLEIVDSMMMTVSMARSISGLPNLEALRLYTTSYEDEEMAPLAQIKNLKHLSLQDHGSLCTVVRMNAMISLMQTMLRNSSSTLQSLSIEMGNHWYSFLDGWNPVPTKAAKAKDSDSSQEGMRLTALKSLALGSMLIEADFINRFDRLVDFTRLRELSLGSLKDKQNLFLDHLTDLIAQYRDTSDRPLSLRYLKLQMQAVDFRDTVEERRSSFEAKCRFIASFDTLTTLKLQEYGWDSDDATWKVGLADVLLQAIVKHKKLEVLKIEYTGMTEGFDVPYLDTQAVEILVEGLPQLRALQFPPVEQELAEISKVLCRSSRLELIGCFPYASWGQRIDGKDPKSVILEPILRNFMSNTSMEGKTYTEDTHFVWERHCRLRRVAVAGAQWWQIGSALKGGKVFTTTRGETGTVRTVRYRPYKPQKPAHPVYSPEVRWVTHPRGYSTHEDIIDAM